MQPCDMLLSDREPGSSDALGYIFKVHFISSDMHC